MSIVRKYQFFWHIYTPVIIKSAVIIFTTDTFSFNMVTESIIEKIGTKLIKIEVLLGPICLIDICCTRYPITEANILIYTTAKNE